MPGPSSSHSQPAADLDEPGIELRIGVASLVVGEADHVGAMLGDVCRGRHRAERKGATRECLSVRVSQGAIAAASRVMTSAPSVRELSETFTCHVGSLA